MAQADERQRPDGHFDPTRAHDGATPDDDALQPDGGRFQGGSGGPASNTGAYAASQTYGGPLDQLGYGSTPGHAPDDAPPHGHARCHDEPD